MATYYVDPVNGNDSNAGTSWGAAKRTPYGLRNVPPVVTFAIGDIVKFPKNTSKVDLTPTLTTSDPASTSGTLSQSIDLFNPFDTWASTGEWIAANGATVSTTTAANKGPSLSYGTVTTPASPANNTKYAYLHKTVWATTPLDFSAYQEIHLYTSANTSGITWTDGMYRLCLCSDTTGDTIVDDLPLECTNVTTGGVWYATFAFNGGNNLGSSIKSIALYSGTSSNIGASKQFRIMAVVAQKTNPVIRYGDLLITDEANKGPIFILDGAIQNGTSASPTIWFNQMEATFSFGKQLTSAPLKRIRPAFRKTSDPDWAYNTAAYMNNMGVAGTGWDNIGVTFSGGWDTSSGLQDGYTYFGDNFSSTYVIGGTRPDSSLGMYALERFVTTRKSMSLFGPSTSPSSMYMKFIDCYSGGLYVGGSVNYMMYWGTTATGFAYKMVGGWLGGPAAGQSVYGASWNISIMEGTVVTGNPNIGSSQTVDWTDVVYYGPVNATNLTEPASITITNLSLYGKTVRVNPSGTGSAPMTVDVDNVDLYNGAGFVVATVTNLSLSGYKGFVGTINDVQNFGTYTTSQEVLGVGHPTFLGDGLTLDVTNVTLSNAKVTIGGNCTITNMTLSGCAVTQSTLDGGVGRTVIDNMQCTSELYVTSMYWKDFIIKNSTVWFPNSSVDFPLIYNCEFYNTTFRNTTPGTNNAAIVLYRQNWTDFVFQDCTFNGVYVKGNLTKSYGPNRTDAIFRNCTFTNQMVSTGDMQLSVSSSYRAPRILGTDITWHRGPLIGQWSFGGDTQYFEMGDTNPKDTYSFFRWNKNATDHRIYNYNGIIQTQTSLVHTAGNVGWMFTRHNYTNKYTYDHKCFNHTLARIVVKEGVAVHLRLWVYNNHAASKMHLIVPGRQVSANQAELIASSSGFQVWEELHVNFTPDSSGVIEVQLGWSYPHALVAATYYWDDFSVAEI